jgi:hypothetical protein
MRDKLITVDQYLCLETKGHNEVPEQFRSLVLYQASCVANRPMMIAGLEGRPLLKDRGLKESRISSEVRLVGVTGGKPG